MTLSFANINSLWGSLIVEELIRHGVDCFVISPGSRSAPLAAAAARNPRARTLVHFDERGAAFCALGYGRAANRPAALICTSGTAAANYLPAIIESSADTVPLLVLTADRPPELRETGANQAIRQPGLFGDNVRWFFDLACPDTSIAPEAVLTTIDQAVYRACRAPSGPVHLNCMFREPLAPVDTGDDFAGYLANLESWRPAHRPYTKYETAHDQPGETCIADIAQRVAHTGNGLLLVGKLQTEEERHAVLALADRVRCPLFADITSVLRLGTAPDVGIPFYNLALASERIRQSLRPSAVLHLGGRITAKRLLEWLEESRPQSYVHVEHNPIRLDPIHRVTRRIESQIDLFCLRLADALKDSRGCGSETYVAKWRRVSATVDSVIQGISAQAATVTEAGIARLLSHRIQNSALFLASSMPIRDMDMFASADGRRIPVGANRGASGIDGTVAAAAGFAIGLDAPTPLLIGDLSLLHDLNSLAILKNLNPPVTAVVINNNGGGIFDHLPISAFPDLHEKFFVTRHDWRFEHAARQFGLSYRCVDTIAGLQDAYESLAASGDSSVIEVLVDRAANFEAQKHLIREITATLNQESL